MIGCSKNQNRICSFWLALPILATVFFSAPVWSAETVEKPTESLPENNSQGDQAEEQPESSEDFKADDFKPSEEISEDFPVPLPSDI
ncbi:MAG: hypothetical protein ACPGF6_02270 [Porticoccaceae bacterium]